MQILHMSWMIAWCLWLGICFEAVHLYVPAPKTKMASWKILHLRMYLLMWIFQLAMLVFGRVSVFVQLLYGSGKYIYLYYDLGPGPRPYSRGKGASYQSFPSMVGCGQGSCCCKLLLQQFVKCTPEHEHWNPHDMHRIARSTCLCNHVDYFMFI